MAATGVSAVADEGATLTSPSPAKSTPGRTAIKRGLE